MHSGWNEYWTTLAEIEFLKNLAKKKKYDTLKKYKEAINLRVVWDNIDRKQIRKTLNRLLKNNGGVKR